ncbi:MAG TPA: amidohydrolase family protein [Vicinamibacterales bacterium]|nr:amidohydrolase family protein [Vicinamibacterales bacterium]
MKVTALILGILALSCSGSGGESKEAPPGGAAALVFRNFTLIDGTGRAPLAPAAMVVQNGRVSWVGAASDLKAPERATVTDLNGAYVIPGLMDMHAHLGNTVDLVQDKSNHTRESVEKDLRTYASYGVTTVMSMGTDQDAVFPVRSDQRSAAANGGPVSMARVYTAGQGLVFKGGYGGLAGVNEAVATPEEAAASVNAQLDKSADVIKLWLDSELGTMPKMPPAISKAIIDTAHKRGARVLAHVFYLEDAKRLVDQGIDGFVHMVRDQPIDQALIDGMEKHGTWQVASTLSREASMFAYGSTPEFAADPFFTRGVSAKTVELIKSPERQKTIAGNPNFKKFPAFFEHAKANLKRLADAGIPFAAGTDAGPPGRFPGYSQHWELQLMVEAGLTPAQAIEAATRRAAMFLGAEDLGTLEPTKWADFVVLDANPLTDIRNSRKIRSVYIAGKEVRSINQEGGS